MASIQNLPTEVLHLTGCFVIWRQTLREASSNDRFWPIPAVGDRADPMSLLGQLRTIPNLSQNVWCR